MNFKFPTRFFTFFIFGASVIPVSATTASDFQIGTWANFCQGAVSHTFDDNTTHQTDSGQALFDAKGFHMTLFTVTGAMSPNWTRLKAAFTKGHEIASHSVTHPGTMPDAECPTSHRQRSDRMSRARCALPSPTRIAMNLRQRLF
jgi:peptidoglycan/xylan/chitin deacetylase (PgdA/CDA1 family)